MKSEDVSGTDDIPIPVAGSYECLLAVAQCLSPYFVEADDLRAAVHRILRASPLAPALAELERIEKATGEYNVCAVESWWSRPRRVVALPPAEKPRFRFPPSLEEIESAARLRSPDEVDPFICEFMEKVLPRSEIAPAYHEMNHIEWAVATPGPELCAVAAFEEWVDAGHLTEELLAAVSDRSASEQAIRDRRYQTPLVVHQLLARERPLRFQDPCRGLGLAKLASGVARATMARAGTDWHRYGGLVALALASRANAHRIVGETLEASGLLAKAESYIVGETDLRLRGHYFELAAATLTHLGRLDESRQATARAYRGFRQLDDHHQMAIELTARAKTDLVAGNLGRKTLRRLSRASEMVDPGRPPEFLREGIQLSVVKHLADLGRVEEAESALEQIGEFPVPSLDYRREAIMGYIHLVARRWQPAITRLSSAVAAMAEVSHVDGGYFQLLLACAHLGANEFVEANRLSLEAARFFSGVQVQSIALEANRVGIEATRGAVTVARILELVRAIEAAP